MCGGWGKGGGSQVKSSAVSSGVITFSFCFERGGVKWIKISAVPPPPPRLPLNLNNERPQICLEKQ